MTTVNKILGTLPPYRDEWILIKENQQVKDIVKRIEIAHKNFAWYYDQFALYFNARTIDQVANNIQQFLKKNIRYQEEPVKRQTTALPTGVLERGYGDCKHYASFAGGVLDAIERLTGKKINWFYRFASYKVSPSLHHVFVVVNDDAGREIWIDPVPGADQQRPTWIKDVIVKVKSATMPLLENIAGVPLIETNQVKVVNGAKISGGSIAVHAVKTHDLNFDNAYPGFRDVWASHGTPVLTLDPGYGHACDAWNGWEIGNLPQLVNELNTEIAKGPEPHVVDGELVNWIWKSSVRSWNFYYKQGVGPDVIQIANEKLPAAWPRPIITSDGRLTFDKLANIGECHNPYIHLLTGAIQKMLNDNLKEQSFIISPNQPVEYMNFKEPGKFDSINMFGQIRGNDLKKILHTVGKFAIKFEEGLMKITLAAPRNAFLALIALNVFHWASHLIDQISAGNWDSISKLWEHIGGNPDRLREAAEKGAKEKAIDENGNYISGPGCAAIGVVQAAAIIGAAVPVIALLLKYIDKSGKASEIVSAATPLLQQQFPDIDWSGLQTGGPIIDRNTGQPVQWSTTNINDENLGGGNDLLTMAVENALPIAAGAGIGSYFLLKKKGKKPNYTIPILIAGGTYLVLEMQKKKFSSAVPGSSTTKLTALINWTNSSAGDTDASKQQFISILKQMSETELSDVYNYVFNYVQKGVQLAANTALYNSIIAISTKYNIFT